MEFGRLCDEILNLDPNILMTGIVEDARLVSSRFRPLVPSLNNERMAIALAQAHLLTSIPKTNEDVFGRVRFTMVYHDNLTTFIFPLLITGGGATDDDSDTDQILLIMVVKPPYDLGSLPNKVLGYLTNTIAP